MTTIFITIDTEYEFAFTKARGLASRAANYARSIAGDTATGAVGIGYQMDAFDRHGFKAVFFIDPMPALVWGVAAVEDIVAPVVARGHDVQLHIHTEWLELAGAANPLGRGRTGRNIGDFGFDDQCRLLDYARTTLIAAGAPPPVAFRAGNYGANDDTLRALAEIGIGFDTSHCPGIAGSACTIGLAVDDRVPVARCGVVEVPIGAIAASGAALRHAQVTALSADEMLSAVRFCRDQGLASFTLASHSFELLSRDRSRVNTLVKRRFDRLCARLGAMPGGATGTYASDPPRVDPRARPALLPFSALRASRRIAEQAVGNMLYGAR